MKTCLIASSVACAGPSTETLMEEIKPTDTDRYEKCYRKKSNPSAACRITRLSELWWQEQRKQFFKRITFLKCRTFEKDIDGKNQACSYGKKKSFNLEMNQYDLLSFESSNYQDVVGRILKKSSLGYAFALLMLMKETLIEQKRPAVTRKNTFEKRNKSLIITRLGNFRRPEFWRSDQNKLIFWVNHSCQVQCLNGCADNLNQASSYGGTMTDFDSKSNLIAVLEKWAIRKLNV